MKEFNKFNTDISSIIIPEKLNSPFYYTPCKLSQLASTQVQEELNKIPKSIHNFWDPSLTQDCGIGKMFGVLVVRNQENKIGFLKAFSGKLQNENSSLFNSFVPNINQDQNIDNLRKLSKNRVDQLNFKINVYEDKRRQDQVLLNLSKEIKKTENELSVLKAEYKEKKYKRAITRKRNDIKEDDRLKLNQESSDQKKKIKLSKEFLKNLQMSYEDLNEKYQTSINLLKKERKEVLAKLQKDILNGFIFYNIKKERESLYNIFEKFHSKSPNSGSGECCAPKLLNFAFQNNLMPISIAEFWWGAPPKNNIRRHKYFYPACTGRCGPILKHMLNGLNLDINPLTINYGFNKKHKTIFEDEHLLIVDKPEGLLTTPGVEIQDSLQTRIKSQYPNLDHIMPIHRLDQGTSGLVIFAKSKAVHKKLQHLLGKRLIKKTYIAILDGIPKELQGQIELPISIDHNNPPFHMVNIKNGKYALTDFTVLQIKKGKALVEFSPITGRTHQLRIHSAHFKGLNSPIQGDDMYGVKSDRMYLHAFKLEFNHPILNERLTLKSEMNFTL